MAAVAVDALAEFKDTSLAAAQKLCYAVEAQLATREAELVRREEAVQKREGEVLQREGALLQREEAVAEQEGAVRKAKALDWDHGSPIAHQLQSLPTPSRAREARASPAPAAPADASFQSASPVPSPPPPVAKLPVAPAPTGAELKSPRIALGSGPKSSELRALFERKARESNGSSSGGSAPRAGRGRLPPFAALSGSEQSILDTSGSLSFRSHEGPYRRATQPPPPAAPLVVQTSQPKTLQPQKRSLADLLKADEAQKLF